MKNQFNGYEKLIKVYINKFNKYTVNADGNKFSTAYRLANILNDEISQEDKEYILQSRIVNKIYHMEVLIENDERQETVKHERFNEDYSRYLNRTTDRTINNAFKSLIGLSYIVRCNLSHEGKTNTGPNRQKVQRDRDVCNSMYQVGLLVFQALMNHPERNLACYGTLKSSEFVKGMFSIDGQVDGYIDIEDDLQYFTNELGTGKCDVTLYFSTQPIDFSEIDVYEGNKYRRIYIPVYSNDRIYVANIYERDYE